MHENSRTLIALVASRARDLAPAFTALLAAMLIATSGCGDGSGAVVGEDDVVADTGGGSGKDTSGGTDDTGGADGAGGTDTASSDGGQDIELTCPGNVGCSCKQSENCYSGHCIDVGGVKACAALCQDGECPEDEACVEVAGNGGSKDKICAPKFATLCAPCTADAACASLGGAAACLTRGIQGSFCASACTTSTDCPNGYLCEPGTSASGVAGKFCSLPPSETCTCPPAALAVSAVTSCGVPHANGGSCTGTRRCLAAGAPGAPDGGGLTACDAPGPATETCDGIDNDCNGSVDEKTCDDSNPCTTDACGGKTGCSHSGTSGAACDADGSICTDNDTCADGVCKPGAAKTCDDGNPCTTDSCDPVKGCQTAPASGEPCNADDNLCTVGDACKDGACVAGTLKACDSGDVCIGAKCDLKDGKCKFTDKNGEPCSDGNPCTTKESCVGDACKGVAYECNDGQSCTADSCDPATGCVHKPVAGPCDDGDACTSKDTCDKGLCVGVAIGVTATCDDGDACTTDGCDVKIGCTHKPKLDGPCDDGNVCTISDVCVQGKCQSGENVCGCNSNSDCEAKEDGNLCNGTLFCDTSAKPFQCKIKPSTVVTCDASLNGECQTNNCNPKSGKCELIQATDGKPCDADGSVCTKDDACKSGGCQTGALVKCDDNNACTDDSCDVKAGCKFTPNSNPCNADDDACTVADTCTSGACVAGKAKACDDGEFCTDDSCAKDSGKCSQKPRVDKCDDANLCTTDDACGVEPVSKLYTCVGGKSLDCNDKNPCTTDQCDAKKGCSFTPVADGASCEDGNACTAADQCAKGACVGQPIDVKAKCDDGNPCSTDGCDPDKGCSHKADDAGLCDDGNACTKNDYCKDSQCTAGVNTCGCNSDSECKGSEDGDLCNGTLYCDKSQQPFQCKVNPGTIVKCDVSINSTCQQNKCEPSTGKCVVNKEKDGTPCKADDNVCTSNDACADGLCKPGALLDCDDKSACTSDSCDPKAGCVATPIAGPCNDGDACTELDSCQGGVCKGAAANEKIKCNDDNDCTLDVCDAKVGCQNKPLDAKACDDGNACTQNDACVQGKCVPGVNTCACSVDSDCKVKEDGDMCNGTLFCDKDKQCKINPVTVVTCDASGDNFCKKTACVALTGKCEATVKTDDTPCDADGSLCTTKDVCKSGACKPGALLVCDDSNVCTADSCDPKQGCVHTPQGGPCDADGDACTVGDACSQGKCAAGKQTACDDNNACTDDACDKTSGKCTTKEIVQSCQDGNACTSGDACGKDTSGVWTCVSGKILTCNDGNACTVDACDKIKGCSNTIDANLSEPCYTFDAKTRGKGECKDGVQMCQQDGSLGTCKGDKGPGSEVCDGKDNNCDGVTDEGCAPTAFVARDGNASGKASGANFGVESYTGFGPVGGQVGPSNGGKFGAKFGFLSWVKALLKL